MNGKHIPEASEAARYLRGVRAKIFAREVAAYAAGYESKVSEMCDTLVYEVTAYLTQMGSEQ
jgi:hypothetical protein